MTDLLVLEARALAGLGEYEAAARAAAGAERMFERVRPAEEPEWARFIDAAYVYGEAAHCFRDLSDVDEIDRFARESAAVAARQGRARRGALSHAALASAQLLRGDAEAAAVTAMHVVDLTVAVDSFRCLETVRGLVEQLAPYGGLPGVDLLAERARAELNVRV